MCHPLVDLVDDLQVSREEMLEKANFPFLQCLGKDSVTAVSAFRDDHAHVNSLGIGKDFGGDLPSLSIRNLFLIDEDSHQLGNRQGRVSIVHCMSVRVGNSNFGVLWIQT